MYKLKYAINSHYLVWLILCIPLLIFTWDYLTEAATYGEYIHLTGDYSAKLLILTLAVTPLQLLFGRKTWTNWLAKNRRYFGVAAFGYATPHLLAYLFRFDWARIWADFADPALWTGWIAFIIFVPLAVTSNNGSLRAMGRHWKNLHRLVYLAAILTFVHWFIVAFDPIPGLIHAGVLLALELLSLGLTWWQSRRRPAAA